MPNGNSLPVIDEFSPNAFSGITVLVGNDDDLAAILVATVMASNPNLEYNEAFDVAELVLETGGNLDGANYDSINYVLYSDNSYQYIIVGAI